MTCRDCYGQALKIGDEVISTINPFVIKGIISDINIINNICYITVNNGNTSFTDESVFFTTPKRRQIMEYNDCNFSLCFYDKSFYPISSFPLVNGIDSVCSVIDETIFAYLNMRHYLCDKCYATEHLLSFRDLDNTDIYHYKGFDYVRCKETFKLCFSGESDIVFENKNDLYEMLYYVIKYFDASTFNENDDEKVVNDLKRKSLTIGNKRCVKSF